MTNVECTVVNQPTGEFCRLALNKFRATKALINPREPAGAISINHNFRKNSSQSAYEYLLNAGVSPKKAELVLDCASELKHEQREAIDPFKLGISELENWVKSNIINIYPLIDSSLNTALDNGFNEHGLSHAEDTLRLSLKLFSDLGIQDERIIQRTVIESLTHDLGNLISRENHEVASVFLLEKLFPELKTRSGQWKLIRKAIIFHNIPFIKTLWNEDSKSQEKIDILSNTFCPDALMLMLTDKTSIGRKRLSTKNIDRESVNKDIHIALNLMALDFDTVFSADRQTFKWLIDFSAEPDLTTDYGNISQLFFHHEGHPANESQAFVPDTWHNLHKLYGIPHINSWYSSFIQTYFNRLELAILSSFALNPQQNIFEICVQDKVGEGSKTSIREQIGKADVDEYLTDLKRKYFPKTARKKYPPKLLTD